MNLPFYGLLWAQVKKHVGIPIQTCRHVSCFMFHVSECSPHLQFLDNAPEVRPSFYLYPGHFALSPMCRPIDFRLHKSLRFVVNFFQDGTHPVVYKWLSHNILPKYDSLIQGNRVSIRR